MSKKENVEEWGGKTRTARVGDPFVPRCIAYDPG